MTSGIRDLLRKGLLGLAGALLLTSSAPAQNPLGTAFTYQGQLQNGGMPQNGPCDLRFKLYDASSGGTQIGSTQTLSSVGISNGLFTVSLDFGASAFTGSARWLESAVACPSGGSFTTLSPLQSLTPAPNALFAEHASVSTNTSLTGDGSAVPLGVAVPLSMTQGSGSFTMYVLNSGTGNAVQAESTGNAALFGHNAGSGSGVFGYTQGSSGLLGAAGVVGDSANYPGVFGASFSAAGVFGTSVSGDGVYGRGDDNNHNGVSGYSQYGTGVLAGTGSGRGLHAMGGTGEAILGDTYSIYPAVSGVNGGGGPGVSGTSAAAYSDGIYGYAPGDPNSQYSGSGVHAIGTWFCSNSSCLGGSVSLLAEGVADFTDAVLVLGDLSVGGNKSFVTPHPTNPSKQINYVSLEGPESGTYFRGTARIVNGFAEIEVPESFRLVTAENGLTAVTSPLGSPATIVCLQKSLEKIVFQGSADVEFDYIVNGVRAGFQDHQAIQDNRLFVPRRASDTSLAKLPAEAVRRLKANGILNEDGTVNEETARRMGWDKRPNWNEPERRPESR